ncbi:hypothetical protein PMNALOAF_3843 [Methylobacterium adhaesivum]|jgi:hypothetical protein|nr:hypothetical protein PMNALOAF_3843 [Methylobacterium adhaesivum]
MRQKATLGQRFLGDRSAVSAVEFAVILPVLMLLTAAGLQLVTYLNAIRKVDLIANSISQIISQASPPQGSTVATVNSLDLHFTYDASMVLFPYVLQDAKRRGISWYQAISINFASIAFIAKVPACGSNADPSECYVATVAWTSMGTAGDNYRRCVTPQLAAADSATPNRVSLPRSVFGPGSIIAVDVVFMFTPTFGAGFIDPIRIARSVYLQPRYATLINYDTTNDDGIAVKCPGY